jgi:hypothetical protein
MKLSGEETRLTFKNLSYVESLLISTNVWGADACSIQYSFSYLEALLVEGPGTGLFPFYSVFLLTQSGLNHRKTKAFLC